MVSKLNLFEAARCFIHKFLEWTLEVLMNLSPSATEQTYPSKWNRQNLKDFLSTCWKVVKTICADYSQGNEAPFGENTGKQCVATSLTAIIYHHIEDINLWNSSTLNNILTIGNNFYTSIRCSVQTNDYLLLTDVPCIVSIYNKVYTLEYSESLTGSLFKASNNGPYMSLQNSLTSVFKLST